MRCRPYRRTHQRTSVSRPRSRIRASTRRASRSSSRRLASTSGNNQVSERGIGTDRAYRRLLRCAWFPSVHAFSHGSTEHLLALDQRTSGGDGVRCPPGIATRSRHQAAHSRGTRCGKPTWHPRFASIGAGGSRNRRVTDRSQARAREGEQVCRGQHRPTQIDNGGSCVRWIDAVALTNNWGLDGPGSTFTSPGNVCQLDFELSRSSHKSWRAPGAPSCARRPSRNPAERAAEAPRHRLLRACQASRQR